MFNHPSEYVTFKASSLLPGVELLAGKLVDHAFAPHVHEAYSLGAIEAGVERFRYQGSDHLAPAGTVVMLNPDELHTGQAEVEAGWTYCMMYIEPQLMRQMAGGEPWFAEAAVHDPALAAALQRSFRQLWSAADDLAFVSSFTLLLDQVIVRHGRDAAPKQPAKLNRKQAAMRRVLECIEANLDGSLQIDTLAAEASMSPFHFVRAFSAAFHVTPHQYVQARRLSRAKLLLQQGARPGQAAAAAGLADQSHLNRWFKRAYGVTPAQYQQQIGTRPVR